ncbi:hypothetical protein PSACC_03369 [Paramicrosporidium saccamoebae]|uniref:Uncharacterized protein n=1 Tax=Paramicrosporidium saccamoebae TaxID=1246581 RepID=A0A2H9TGA3_9FUNG|nr:hypothetical protein PSACC_03369 [Paramicrosporidium saccamoebae]
MPSGPPARRRFWALIATKLTLCGAPWGKPSTKLDLIIRTQHKSVNVPALCLVLALDQPIECVQKAVLPDGRIEALLFPHQAGDVGQITTLYGTEEFQQHCLLDEPFSTFGYIGGVRKD